MHNFDEAVKLALRTWHSKGHELRFNDRYPLGKLLGGWGSLLDDYIESIHRPGHVFEPASKLGDIWYYLRILCYQRNYLPAEFQLMSNDIDFIISTVMHGTAEAFNTLCQGNRYSVFALDISYSAVYSIAVEHNLTLQQLTQSNWEKLKLDMEKENNA